MMNSRKLLQQTFGLTLVVMLLTGCGAPSSPMATPTPVPPTATPSAGVGVPVGGGSWQVAIQDAREEISLSSGYYPNQTTYTPKEGYTFLVVEAEFRSLDPAQPSGITSTEVAVIDVNGEIHTAEGGGWSSSDMCVGCIVWTSGGGRRSSTSFVFVVKKELIDQPWKLQFQDMPPLV